MKILSFNFWGISSLPKRLALKHIVEYDHPKIIFLQETLGQIEYITQCWEGLLVVWGFISLDVSSHSSSLAIGWNKKLIKFIAYWRIILGLCIEVFFEELGRPFSLLNVYGPNHNQKDY